jgi:misacylated tRNA(Ala) deacylase
MTEPLFIQDSYLREHRCQVVAHTPEGGVVLERPLFYPTGGGQPGDSGRLHWDGHQIRIATTVKGQHGEIIMLAAEPSPLPPVGTEVMQDLDWDRRFRIMQMHTALHLLSVVISLPVTGGAIGSEKGRLDFDMPEAPAEKSVLQDQLNALLDRDFAITDHWISDQELAENPQLIKMMSVKPPVGAGKVRLIQIGEGPDLIDLQPCGGTHVARTGEISPLVVAKIEKKGRQNRRVTLRFGP